MQPQEPQQQQVPDSINPGEGQPMDTDQPCQPDSGVDTSGDDHEHLPNDPHMGVIGKMLICAGILNIIFGATCGIITALSYNFQRFFLELLCGVPVSYIRSA